jgi:glycosyltransferase involved in cell wall biosynthesis
MAEAAVRNIAAIENEAERPFWSVMIPTRGCSPYLEQALLSLRDQDPGPEKMQIAIVDDASSGDLVEETARRVFGPRLEMHRCATPLGIAGNWNRCIDLSRGRWVHLLHQDDLVHPGFYERLADADLIDPEAGAAFCRNWVIDRDGVRTGISTLERATAGACEDWLERIAVSNRIQCPSIVVRRRVYEELGGFRSDLAFALDWEMWVRITCQFPVYYEPEALAAFRRHDDSETLRLCDDGSNVVDLLRAIEIVNKYLPPNQRGVLRQQALRYCVQHALHCAQQMLGARNHQAAHAQLREALKLDPSLRLNAHVWSLYGRSIWSWIRDHTVSRHA